MKKMKLIAKIASCLLVIFLLSHVNGRVNNSVKAEVAAWYAGSYAYDHTEVTTVAIMTGAFAETGGRVVGSAAGAWVGGALGSLAGPAGAVFGVWAGRIVGGRVGGW